jgi:putative N6-adenine-specific DNA methylase
MQPAPAPICLTCARGLAGVLKDEASGLGFNATGGSESSILTRGTLRDAMRLNLHLRTANRVLLEVGTFPAREPPDVYRGVRALPWEEILHADGYFCITATVRHSSVRDPRYPALVCKDAIADRMREKAGARPSSGPDLNRAVLHLHWEGESAAVSIDTSGESLSRRGYRRRSVDAPMRETLAAGCVLLSGWQPDRPFLNPMCGSGTLAIEAALIARRKAPGSRRGNFGFMHVMGYREKEWKELLREAAAGEVPAPAPIVASDISPKAVEAARANADAAGVGDAIEFDACDFRESTVSPGPGTVILNPEYGERVGHGTDLQAVYKGIGDFFKQRCQGYTGWVFTGNLKLAKGIGLHAQRRIALFNGPLECRLIRFDLYAGTRRPPLAAGDH